MPSPRKPALSLIVWTFAAFLLAQERPSEPPYDLVIQGGTLADGSGNRPWSADVAVRGDRIAAIGDLSAAPRKRTIDAKGLAVEIGRAHV